MNDKSRINAVISTSKKGEIVLDEQISLPGTRDRNDKNFDFAIGNKARNFINDYRIVV